MVELRVYEAHDLPDFTANASEFFFLNVQESCLSLYIKNNALEFSLIPYLS
jgi:hypothetical protein